MPKHHQAKPEPGHIPQSINPNLRRKPKKGWRMQELLDGILAGNPIVLGQAITLIESSLPADRVLANQLIEACLPHSGNSFRLGITGTPGVGKSTFIEAFGMHLLEQKHKVAVLAVDPSSQLTKGSILGDKTRMEQLAAQPQVFIRPSPAGNALGGVAARTRETIILCETAGFHYILVETVGVGQSEVAVHALTDFFLLLLLPGAGDELQGIKRGVVEMADLIVINKADGDRVLAAKKAQAVYQKALHLFPAKESNWIAKALACSALEGTGISDISKTISEYRTITKDNRFFERNRQNQTHYWLHETLRGAIMQQFYQNPELAGQLKEIETEVVAGQRSVIAAAELLLSQWKKS